MKCLLFCFLEMGTASSDSEKAWKGLAFTSASTFIYCWSMGELTTHQRLASLTETCALLPQEQENQYTSPTHISAT